MNLTIIDKGLPKKQTEQITRELYENIGGVLEKTYQKVDALLRPKFKTKKFCNCCGKCCKSMAIPIMPVEALNITIRLMNNESFYERCKDYYFSQLRGGIKKAIVCPYQLDDGKCGIYDIRPLVCRTWLSTQENCLGKATTAGTIFDKGKLKYYPETLKYLSKFIFDIFKDVEKSKFVLTDNTTIQMPLLHILSHKTGKEYRLNFIPCDDSNLSNPAYSKDFVKLCEDLSGKTYNIVSFAA